jgi:hypothetical protein
MKRLIFILTTLALASILPTACKEEAVKLTRADRDMIDTLVQKQVVQITPELDRYCRDSSPILRKQYVDSLLLVRQQEIQQQSILVR